MLHRLGGTSMRDGRSARPMPNSEVAAGGRQTDHFGCRASRVVSERKMGKRILMCYGGRLAPALIYVELYGDGGVSQSVASGYRRGRRTD